MNIFSFCNDGVKTASISGELSLQELILLIKSHPQKKKINELKKLIYGKEAYKTLKENLPYITPHGTFKVKRANENVQQFSGFFYLDIDAIVLPNGPEEMRQYILMKHYDKVALMGLSVGGGGLFMYIRIDKPELVTASNFDAIHRYICDTLFPDVPIDKNAMGIARSHIIPWDPNVYHNPTVTVCIPGSVLNQQKLITRSTKTLLYSGSTSADKFVSIVDVIRKIKNTTEVDVGNMDVMVKNIPCCKVHVPRFIKDGQKHKVYRAMVNCIMHNNPGIEYNYILSFISHVNNHYTGDRPMIFREMEKTVKAEYIRIMKTGEIFGLKNKRYHSNPKHDTITRRRNVAKVRGKEQVDRSIFLIAEAVKQLEMQGMINVTAVKLADRLKGKLSIPTIYRHWRSVVPKRLSSK